MAKITFDSLLEGEFADPRPGDQYELMEGLFVTLKRPTIATHDAVAAIMREPEGHADMEIVRMVVDGIPEDLDEGEVSAFMPAKIVADFIELLGQIGMRVLPDSAASEAVAAATSLNTDGP